MNYGVSVAKGVIIGNIDSVTISLCDISITDILFASQAHSGYKIFFQLSFIYFLLFEIESSLNQVFFFQRIYGE